MTRLKPKETVIKRLFALSGNKCAFPNCSHQIVDDDGFVLGEVCHIEAAEPGGERYNPTQDDEARRCFENLVLFCRNHHAQTNNQQKYPVEILQQYKKNHEALYLNDQFVIPPQHADRVLSQVASYLDKIYDAITETKQSVERNDVKLQGIEDVLGKFAPQLQFLVSKASADYSEIYADQIASILQLRKQEKPKSALEALQQFKKDNWNKITTELQYKIQANLGVLFLDLGEKESAGFELIKITELGYQTADSFSFLCLGYAYLHKYEQFEEVFQKALSLGADNLNLWLAFIAAKSDKMPVDEVFDSIPEQFRSKSEVQFAMGQVYIRFNKFDEGIAMLKKSIEGNSPSDLNKWQVEAIIITARIQQRFKWEHLPINDPSDADRKLLENLIADLTRIWTIVEPTDYRNSAWFILSNRAICHSVIGEKASALTDFLTAWEYHKSCETFRNLLSHCIEIQDYNLAQRIINDKHRIEFKSEEDRIVVEIFICNLWATIGKIEEMEKTIESLVQRARGEIRHRVLNSAVLLLNRSKMYTKALEYAELAASEFPELPDGFISLASCWACCGNPEESVKNLDKAVLILESKPHKPMYWIQIGIEFFALKQFKSAACCLEKYPAGNSFNELNRMLLKSYFQGNDLHKCIQLGRSLLLKEPANPTINEILFRSYSDLNEDSHAVALLENYFRIGDSRAFDHFRLLGIRHNMSVGRKVEAAALAAEIESIEPLDINQRFTVADLLVNFGDARKGREVAYTTRLQFYDLMEAHQGYFQIILKKEEPLEILFPKYVSMECGVTLQDSKGGDKQYFLSDDPLAKGPGVLRSDAPLTLILLNSEVGDDIINQSVVGVGSRMKLTQIMNKYTFAFRESMDLLVTKYAGKSGMIMGSL